MIAAADSSQVKPSASSFAVHATVIPSSSWPRSSCLLQSRCVLLAAERRVLGPALRHVAVAAPPPVRLEFGQVRLLACRILISFAVVLADRHGQHGANIS